MNKRIKEMVVTVPNSKNEGYIVKEISYDEMIEFIKKHGDTKGFPEVWTRQPNNDFFVLPRPSEEFKEAGYKLQIVLEKFQ